VSRVENKKSSHEIQELSMDRVIWGITSCSIESVNRGFQSNKLDYLQWTSGLHLFLTLPRGLGFWPIELPPSLKNSGFNLAPAWENIARRHLHRGWMFEVVVRLIKRKPSGEFH